MSGTGSEARRGMALGMSGSGNEAHRGMAQGMSGSGHEARRGMTQGMSGSGHEARRGMTQGMSGSGHEARRGMAQSMNGSGHEARRGMAQSMSGSGHEARRGMTQGMSGSGHEARRGMTAPNERKWKYADIVDLPHPVSKNHPPMSMEKRAAQFAPFSALTGYGEAVSETARLTEEEIELSDDSLETLNRSILEAAASRKEITIEYFIPDETKSGGRYATATGIIRKIGMHLLTFEQGISIPLERIIGAYDLGQ